MRLGATDRAYDNLRARQHYYGEIPINDNERGAARPGRDPRRQLPARQHGTRCRTGGDPDARASTGLNSQADRLIKYFRKRAKHGGPEARRDWLNGAAGIPNGDDVVLDEAILWLNNGADDGFELVYVYDREPVFCTCKPKKYVRNKAEQMELRRQLGAMRRWK